MANDFYLQIIDKKREDFIGKTLFEALPAVQSAVEPLLNDVYWKGIPYNGTEFEVPINRHGKIELSWFNFVYQPLREENIVTGIVVVCNEVTEQVRRKKQLEENERKFRGFIDQSPIAFDDVSGLPPARARSAIADQVTSAIARLSGQEYVHIYASARKARLAMGASPSAGTR